jgi:hypothetical protein
VVGVAWGLGLGCVGVVYHCEMGVSLVVWWMSLICCYYWHQALFTVCTCLLYMPYNAHSSLLSVALINGSLISLTASSLQSTLRIC